MINKILFNGKPIPEFIKVRKINTSILPEVTHNFKEITGTYGLIEKDTSFGSKIIECEVILVVPEGKTLLQILREVAVWLKGDNFKLSSLILPDEPNMVYQAKIQDSVQISDILVAGEGIISFIVPSGIASHIHKKFGSFNGRDAVTIYYQGTAKTFPVFEFIPDSNIDGSLRFTHLESGTMTILSGNFKAGEKIIVDSGKKFVKIGEKLNMKVINIESDWISFEERKVYTIKVNNSGKLSCWYEEKWL